jgi:L-alanine-DL-glutamate epimerase-like enolase superfamily enzyme
MNKITCAAAAVMLVASPAFAQPIRRAAVHHVAAAASDVVTVDGQYVGRDPDANVRAELRRDYGSYLGDD